MQHCTTVQVVVQLVHRMVFVLNKMIITIHQTKYQDARTFSLLTNIQMLGKIVCHLGICCYLLCLLIGLHGNTSSKIVTVITL